MSTWHPYAPPALIRKIGYCLLPVMLGAGAALVLLLAASGPAGPVYASTLTYPGCAATIQACIDNANSGDTILITAGDYTESLTLSKAVSLTGALSSTTILHALPLTRVLTVDGAAVDSRVVISGLTFAGGNLTGTAFCPEDCGGGILIASPARPRLVSAILLSNAASSNGGGLFAYDGLDMLNVQFIGNASGGNGGGAALWGPSALQSGLFRDNHSFDSGGGLFGSGRVALTGTQFVHNTTAAVGGGAMLAGLASIQGGQFEGNACGAFCAGGGLYSLGGLALTGTRFISNTSSLTGGGAYIDHGTVQGALFESNHCLAAACYGGGVYGSGSIFPYLLTLSDTQFVNNAATMAGGGMEADGPTIMLGGLFDGNQVTATVSHAGGLAAGSALTLTGTVFTHNQAAGQGGAFAHLFFGSSRLVNALFAGNSAPQGAALFFSNPGGATLLHNTIATPTLGSGAAIVILSGTVGITDTIITSYTTGISLTAGSAIENYNLFSGVAVSTTGGVGHGEHSVTGNPAFRNPAAGDYHLTAGSAAVDTGADAGVNTDFEDDHRPSGVGFDIGYDEARSPSAVGESYSTSANTALLVSVPGVLENDSTLNAGPLSAVLATGSATGTLVLAPTGAFTYTPPLNFTGQTTFTYRASDGQFLSAPAVVTITVNVLKLYLPLLFR